MNLFKLRIKELRKEKNITQSELARRMKVDRSYVSKIENKSHSQITLGVITNIVKALEIDESPYELFPTCNYCRYKKYYDEHNKDNPPK